MLTKAQKRVSQFNLGRYPTNRTMSISTESRPLPVRVLKFGGSSVGDPDAIRRVIDIIQTSATENRVVVVVSALARVTNTLDAMLRDPATDRT